ncbi:MAG: DUF2235 domain-containing protein [Thalassovita sp.]
MKRIVFFCDGTSNRLDAERPTHVAQLAQATTASSPDGVCQLVFYQQGVGTGRGSNRFARATDRMLGGAFGWGLDDNLLEAYRHLILNYEIDDEIYIFGFSRGAYTARSLAGLIRKAGIPPRDKIGEINKAIAHYRTQGDSNSPREIASIRFRAGFSPDISTSKADQTWRGAQGLPSGHLLRIKYLGIWDTVGALGLPSVFGKIAEWTNSKYNFHDAVLSSSVSAARHAVAIDERRRLYPANTWNNLPQLNQSCAPQTRYQQLWFPGHHSVVGGSGRVAELSAITMHWIAEGAFDEGLRFTPGYLETLKHRSNPDVPVPKGAFKAGLMGAGGLLLSDRKGPQTPEAVSKAAKRRVNQIASYRPGALKNVLKALLSNHQGPKPPSA